MRKGISAFRIYRLLDRNEFTRRAARLIASKYELLYGRDERAIAGKVCGELLVLTMIVILVSIGINLDGMSLFGILSTMFFIKVAFTEVLSRRLHKVRSSFYRDFMEYIEQVRHQFYRTSSVNAALWEACSVAGRSMQLHGNQLYQVLMSEDIDTSRQSYMETCPDRYLRLFATLVFQVDEEGDHIGLSGSEFLSNLKKLKLDIAEELRFEERKMHKFTGLSLTAALPLVGVPYLGRWGTDMVDGMAAFYTGSSGIIVRDFCLFFCYVCYSAVITLREGEFLGKSGHEIVEALAGHRNVRKIVNFIISRNPSRTDRIRELIGRLGENYSIWGFTVRRILEGLCGAAAVGTMAFAAWKRWFYIVPLAAIGGVSGFFLPCIKLELKKEIVKGNRQEEIIRLQSVISICLNSSGTTVLRLLSAIEEFAEVFRPAIRTCINEFVIDEEAALNKMKLSDTYLPFRYLCDCFLMADEVGVNAAFDELVEDLNSQRENNRLELSILAEDRMYLAMLLAVLPGMFILFGYLLIPFLINAMEMFNSYAGQLENMLTEGGLN